MPQTMAREKALSSHDSAASPGPPILGTLEEATGLEASASADTNARA